MTDAVFVIVPLVAVTSAWSVIVAEAPLASVPNVHVNGSEPLQEPWDGVASTYCRPVGSEPRGYSTRKRRIRAGDRATCANRRRRAREASR